MLAIGNDEINEAPMLGKTVNCWVCGKNHRVKYADGKKSDGSKGAEKLLAYFKCGKEIYLCGIKGHEIRPGASDEY